jgi:hypothetical protein
MNSNDWSSLPEWLPALLIAAVFSLTAFAAVLGVVWQTRARAARRWKALLDAYAQREIARQRPREIPNKVRTLPTSGNVLT